MTKSLTKSFQLFVAFVILSATIFSCSSTKKIKYFQDIPDSGTLRNIPKAVYSPPVIQVDDILTIVVETLDITSTSVINSGNIPVSATGIALAPAASSLTQQVASGYLVDKSGSVVMPILGKIKVAGYTTSQAADTIQKIAQSFYHSPTVIVRFANFKVSVMGEVLKPGVYVMPNEKVTIMDALADAGDLTVFGKRDNVLLLRENLDGTKTPYRLNLKKSDVISSPSYYLKQNDVIYVETLPGKSDANDVSQVRFFTLVGTALSVLIVLFSRR